MRKHKVIALTLLFVTIAAICGSLFACMGEDPKEDEMDYLLRQGRKSLEIGQGSMAYNFFRRALSIDPNNREAQYGFVLALDLRVFSFIDGIIDLLAGVFIFEPSRAECEDACARIDECDLYSEAWTDPENCIYDCPFGLQPFMFDTFTDGSSCYEIRDFGLEWIIPTSKEDCAVLCQDLADCDLIHPPVTFTVEECTAHCPYSYVERHSKCYMEHIGQCNGNDRTCFEHITVGLQILFREIGVNIPPKAVFFADNILKQSDDYQYYLDTYNWSLIEPPVQIELDGRFAHGSLHFSKALAHAFQFILLGATAVNLEMNFPSFDINFNYGAPDGTDEIMAALIRVIEILLYDPIFPLGFQIVDEPWAFEQITESGQELGMAAGALANGFEYALNDTDRQQGKSFGYTDANNNFKWDDGEVWTLKGLEFVTLDKAQAVAFVDLLRGMEANLAETREPLDLDLVINFMEAGNMDGFTWLIDLLKAWYPDGKMDMSYIFYEPNKNNMRNWLEKILEKLRIIATVI